MATEKQLKANRENAKRSTGPKTLAGRLKSSRNALRHGLSIPATDHVAGTQTYEFLKLLIPETASQFQHLAVFEVARAQAQLQRVVAVRKDLLKKLNMQSPSCEQVRRLAALERYERQAHRERRRATDRLRNMEQNQDDFE
jgi:hypothetical protein